MRMISYLAPLAVIAAALVGWLANGSYAAVPTTPATDVYAGRLQICVDVDGANVTRDSARAAVAAVVTSELRDHPGWYGRAQRPQVVAGCPFRPSSITARFSAPQAGTDFRPPIVLQPSPFVLHVYVTSPNEVARVFGRLADQSLAEELVCVERGVCVEATSTVLIDPRQLQDRPELVRQVARGLGLTPPSRSYR